MNPYYNFLRNMWIMRKADKEYLQARVSKKQISENEFQEIVKMEQIPVQ